MPDPRTLLDATVASWWSERREYVDANGRRYSKMSVRERVIKKTTIGGPRTCWEWQGARLPHSGHGQIRVDGRSWVVHRLVYTALIGDIPADQVVMHVCDNPSCINPLHLRLGTQLDNIGDCKAKRRARNANSYKSHCPRGHEYAGYNLIIRRNGYRTCRSCANERRARLHKRRSTITTALEGDDG